MKLLSVALFALLLAGGCTTTAPMHESVSFSSSGGRYRFSVRYPASWHRLGKADDVLDIVNFPPGQWTPGFVLPRSGAMISVIPAPEGMPSIESWIGKVAVHFSLLLRREIQPSAPHPGSCTRLVEAQWKVRQSASASTVVTAYYCLARPGLYRIELTDWDGNPHQSELEEVALTVARSLEVHPASR